MTFPLIFLQLASDSDLFSQQQQQKNKKKKKKLVIVTLESMIWISYIFQSLESAIILLINAKNSWNT